MPAPKHQLLRDFLTQALPELARNPDKLSIYLTGGRLVSRYGPNLGFEYRALLQIDMLGFTGDPAAFFLPLVMWLRRHEPAALLNHETGDERLRFEIDIVDNGAVDISITLPMSEAVDVLQQEDGSHQMTLREELPIIDEMPLDGALDDAGDLALLRRVYVGGELLGGDPGP